MSENLKLCSAKRFNDAKLEYYIDTANGDLWITREQLGTFLEYAAPYMAISHIHKRHADRLDKFSKHITVKSNSGEHTVIAYSFKGLLEICRHSRQANAHTLIDYLWEFIAEIEKGENL